MDQKKKRRSSLRIRLLASFLAIGVLPAMLLAAILLGKQTSDLEEQSQAQLVTLVEGRSGALNDYLERVRGQVRSFAHNRMVIDAMREFPGAFESMGEETGVDNGGLEIAHAEVESYYSAEFLAAYREQNGGKEVGVADLVDSLDDSTVLAQYAYVAGNRYPLGSKHKLDDSGNNTSYDKLHANVHPSVRDFLERFGFYDIFLVDAKSGKVVYSVYKEVDYGTSLLDGPYADTNFGQAFRRATVLRTSDDYVWVDFDNYTPSYDAPASFIASPIYDGRELLGVAMFQMPIDRMSQLLAQTPGLGEHGDAYVVGPDFKMRTDSLQEEEFSTVASFRENKLVEQQAVQLALKGEEGVLIEPGLGGVSSVLAYAPMEIDDTRYAIVTSMIEDEAFAAAATARNITLGFMLATVLILVAIAVWTTRGIGRAVEQVVGNITEQAKGISRGDFGRRNDPTDTKFREFVPVLSSINEVADAYTSQMDAIPVPIVVHDAQLITKYANAAAAELSGTSAAELVGGTFYEHVTPDGWKDPGFITRRSVADGVGGAEADLTCSIGGSERDLRSVQTSIAGPDGVTAAVMETLLDQTDVRASQRRQEKVAQFQSDEADRLSQTLECILAGDLSARYSVTPTEDEDVFEARDSFARIAEGIGRTVADFGQTIRTMSTSASTMAESADNLAGLAEQLLTGTDATARQATSVAAATEQMSTNVDSVAAAAEEMSINIGSVSETASAMSSKMRDVAEAVSTLSTSIANVAENARSGSAVAAEAASKSQQANGAMETLGVAATEIGKVTEVIKRIAEKTNLLALNATIEAASAGEAGKGFAVVAHEVKELANQCATAAEDITERIAGVQRNTTEAVVVITSMTEIIENLAEASDGIASNAHGQSQAVSAISTNVGEVDEGVERTASAIAEIVQGANDVSRNAGELSSGAGDVSSSIGEVSGLARSGGEAAEQVGTAARELRQIVERQREFVSRFDVDRGDRPELEAA